MLLRHRQEQGVAILTVLVIVIILAGVSSAFFVLSKTEFDDSNNARLKLRATYLAEAGAEIAANQVRQDCANQPGYVEDPTLGYPGVDRVVVIDGVQVQCRAIRVATIAATPPPPLDVFQTWHASFEIMGYAKVGNPNKPSSYQDGLVYRIVEANGTPLFQNLATFSGDLELNPGPFAHFHGRIHSNKNIYVSTRSADGLILDTDMVQTAGKFYRTYSGGYDSTGAALASASPVETGADGNVYVRKSGTLSAGDGAIDAAAMGSGHNPTSADAGLVSWDGTLNSDSPGFGTLSGTAMSNWNGTVRDKTMGAQTLTLPDLGTIKPGGSFNNLALAGGIEIVNDGTNNISFKVNGATQSPPSGAISTSTIYDAREGTAVPVTTVDMGLLLKNMPPSNGIIYMTDKGAAPAVGTTPAVVRGLQLVNGSLIGMPLSVVSNLPVYVKGDYNGATDTTTGLSTTIPTGGYDASGQPNTRPATLDASGAPVAAQPCAIIGDAINLLSRGWDGSKSAPSTPTALPTSYNFAMVAGNTTTQYSSDGTIDHGYSGGLQNLPRFHENWGGVRCNYAGSFVNLFQSQIAAQPYGKGGVYVPPDRHWDFDPIFSKGKGPPGAPFSISIGRTTYEEGAVRTSGYTLTPR